MDKEKGKLNKRLQNFGFEPSPEIWGNLEAHLAKKRKPRAPFWWFLAAGLFLPMVAGIWFWNSRETKQEPNQTIVQNEKSKTKVETNTPNVTVNTEKERTDIKENKQTLKQTSQHKTEGSDPQMSKRSKDDLNKSIAQNETKTARKKNRLSSENTLALAIAPSDKTVKKSEKSGGNINPPIYKKKKNGSAYTFSEQRLPPTQRSNITGNTRDKQKALAFQNSQNENSNGDNPEKLIMENSSAIRADNIALFPKENKTVGINQQNTSENQSIKAPVIESVNSENNSVQAINTVNNLAQNKKPDSAFVAKEDSVATNTAAVDSSEKEDKFRKSSWFVFAGVKASVYRTISINQNAGETRISIDEQASSFYTRLGYDAGIRYEKFFNTWIGIHGNLGISILQDEIHFTNSIQSDGYEITAKNGELRYLPNSSSSREKLKSTLTSGFCSIGLSIKPIRWLPVFRFNGGIQSSFFTSITKTISGISGTYQTEKWTLQNPVYSFQISVVQPVPLKKGELWIEPFFQYYNENVFEFRPGNYSVPAQTGLQVSYKW